MSQPKDPFTNRYPASPSRAIWDESEFSESRGYGQAEMLRNENQVLKARIASLDDKPLQEGYVVQVSERNGKKWVHFVCGGQRLRKEWSSWMGNVKVGDCVEVSSAGAQPVAFKLAPTNGFIVTAIKTHEDGAFVEYEMERTRKVVACGIPVIPGDRLLVEQTGSVIIRSFGQEQVAAAKTFTRETGVSWDDIGGLVDIKKKMRAAIEGPYLHKALYKKFGKKPCKGIGLFGGAGLGKTMLGKAAATSLAALHGQSAVSTGFIYVKGAELLHGLVGSSESAVRDLFDSARAHEAEHGYPAIIFLDEADALLKQRGRESGVRGGMEETLVPMFLAEMDGLDGTGAIMLLTSNRPEAIDKAFLRKGRIDLKLHFTPPDKSTCIVIFEKAMAGKPYAKGLAKAAVELLFEKKEVTPTGALVVGLAEDATQAAIDRVMEAGQKDGSVTLDDVKAALVDLTT